MFYTLIYLKDIPYPGLKFKGKYAGWDLPREGQIHDNFVRCFDDLEVDTKEGSTFKKAFV